MYTLWKHPGILPLLHTPNIVLDKMRSGADLMTPGLAHGPPFPAKATKGATVAIASYENPSVPVVVGECEIDVSSLKSVRGTKGHAVRGLHWHGDEIWGWSQNEKPGSDPPDQVHGWFEGQDIEQDDVAAAQQGVEDLKVEDAEDEESGGVSVNGIEGQRAEGPYVEEFEKAPLEKKEWTTKGRWNMLQHLRLLNLLYRN